MRYEKRSFPCGVHLLVDAEQCLSCLQCMLGEFKNDDGVDNEVKSSPGPPYGPTPRCRHIRMITVPCNLLNLLNPHLPPDQQRRQPHTSNTRRNDVRPPEPHGDVTADAPETGADVGAMVGGGSEAGEREERDGLRAGLARASAPAPDAGPHGAAGVVQAAGRGAHAETRGARGAGVSEGRRGHAGAARARVRVERARTSGDSGERGGVGR
nr:hypothetical protein CFP56_31725 [Quercus suber]